MIRKLSAVTGLSLPGYLPPFLYGLKNASTSHSQSSVVSRCKAGAFPLHSPGAKDHISFHVQTLPLLFAFPEQNRASFTLALNSGIAFPYTPRSLTVCVEYINSHISSVILGFYINSECVHQFRHTIK